MSDGARIPLAKAQHLAGQVEELLSPYCDRIQVAGSVRCERAGVGDIEFVLIPSHETDLLGERRGARPLDTFLQARVEAGKLEPISGHRRGFKVARYVMLNGITLELYVATRETWGVLLAVRTGPTSYSKLIVTERRMGGLLRDYHCIRNGWQLHRMAGPGQMPGPCDTLEEEDFLEYAGGWVDPPQRGAVRTSSHTTTVGRTHYA